MSRRPARRERPGRKEGGPGIEVPAAGAWTAALWAPLLLAAPAASNWFWGVNGFRSLPSEGRAALLLLAGAATALVALRRSPGVQRALAVSLAVALAVVLAFPFRERLHFLGDTQVRLRAMAIFNEHLISVTLAEWSTRLHANPLDIGVNFLAPIGLRRIGAPGSTGVSLVSAALACLFLAGTWRVAGRLGAPAATRLAVTAALAIAGSLEAFAGYAESAGLLLACAAWWWAEMLAPLDRTGQAARVAGTWLALVLGHRLGLVMLVPLAWRILGPPLAGDRPEMRRQLALMSAAALALAAGAMVVLGGGRQLGMDTRDMLAAAGDMVRAVPPSDVLNALALVAPLAFLAPWLAGRTALAALVRVPAAGPPLVAAIVLLPLVWLIPANDNGLGAHRDWDLAVLAGYSLTLVAATLLARLPEPRLRGALLVALPLLVLQAGGWVAVNADPRATMRRARALVEDPPGLAEPHESHLHVYLGQHAMDIGQPALAAPEFERAFELNRNPRRALFAAEAWALSGDLVRARSALARGRAGGPLSPTIAESARQLEHLIGQLTADSARAAAGAARGAGP